MRRRTLLQLSLSSSMALSVLGCAATKTDTPLKNGRLSSESRQIFNRVGEAVLTSFLPVEPTARVQALEAMTDRIEVLIAGLPMPTQGEMAELLMILGSSPGRLGLMGMLSPWDKVSTAELQTRLNGLRYSSLGLKQQVYMALHEVVTGAYFVEPSTWAALPYPGPVKL